MKAENVKVGQRVRVYYASNKTGVVTSTDATVASCSPSGAVHLISLPGWFHCSQLRLLKPKKKQPMALDDRRWWANVYPGDVSFWVYASRELADLRALPKLRTEVWELAIVARMPVGKKS